MPFAFRFSCMLIPVYREKRKVRNNIRSFLTLFPRRFYTALFTDDIILPFFIRNSPEGCPGQRCKVSSYFLCCLPGKSGIRGPLRCLPAGRSPLCGSVPIQRVFVLPALCRSSGEKVTDLNRYAVIGQIRVRLFIQGFRKHTCPHL